MILPFLQAGETPPPTILLLRCPCHGNICGILYNELTLRVMNWCFASWFLVSCPATLCSMNWIARVLNAPWRNSCPKDNSWALAQFMPQAIAPVRCKRFAWCCAPCSSCDEPPRSNLHSLPDKQACRPASLDYHAAFWVSVWLAFSIFSMKMP